MNQAVVGIGERVAAIRRAQVELRRKLTDCAAVLHSETDEFEAVLVASEALERAVRLFQYVDEPHDLLPDLVPEREPELIGQPGGM